MTSPRRDKPEMPADATDDERRAINRTIWEGGPVPDHDDPVATRPSPAPAAEAHEPDQPTGAQSEELEESGE